jgi:hypothetical protein
MGFKLPEFLIGLKLVPVREMTKLNHEGTKSTKKEEK